MLDDAIHAGAEATVTWLTTKDPGLKQLLDEAYGYAVFPALGRASAVLGVARGHGEIFEQGKPIGFASLTQMTVGAQVGGQTFSELILFGNKDALETFKRGKVSFTANASAVLLNAGATGTSDFRAVVAKAYSRGGMLLEASIGGQKFTFHEHLPDANEKKREKESKQVVSGERAAEATVPSATSEEQPTFASKSEESAAREDESGENIEAKSAEEAAAIDTEAEVAGVEEARPEAEGAEYEAVAPEVAPDESFEPPREEGAEYEAEAGEKLEPEEGVEPAPELDEGDALLRAEEAEPGHVVSTATRAIPRSSPQGQSGSADTRISTKAGAGIRRRLADSGRKLVGTVVHVASKRGATRGFERFGLAVAAKRYPMLVGKPLHLLDKVKAAATGLEKEATLGPVLSAEVSAALRRMTDRDPGLNDMLDKAYGHVVFPLVGKAAAALGVGFGRGAVFERGKWIGYAGIAQLTLGVQVGGETYDELIVFENEGALERFKSDKLAFAANASAVIVKAGAAVTTNYSSGTAVFVHPEGGLMLELGLGGQKFFFRRKVLGAPEVEAPELKLVEGGVTDQARAVQRESATPELKTTESKPEGRAEERKGEASELAPKGARTKATLAAARTKAAVEEAGGTVKRRIGALMRHPRRRA